MKLLGWALGTLFSVWLIAFTYFKWADLGCAQDWTICALETGVWFRKLVLLEWASKWQALIAGALAVTGGFATIYAAKVALAATVEQERLRHSYNIISHAAYLAELFRQTMHSASSETSIDIKRWEDIANSIKAISPIHPKFSSDLFYLWGLVIENSDQKRPALHPFSVAGCSAIAHVVLSEIVNFHERGRANYPKTPIKATPELLKHMDTIQLLLSTKLENASLLFLIQPMDQYIDFSGTKYKRNA